MARTESGNRIVIQGIEQGSVFPRSREELLKSILVDGRQEPFEIQGGLYSENLEVVGPGLVNGPVFAGENLRLQMGGGSGQQRLLGGVTAYRSIAAALTDNADLAQSPAADLAGIRFVIRGDVTATESIQLRNTLVIGSVAAPSIDLHASIVLGSLYATRAQGHIHAVCSGFGLYRAKRLTMEGPTTLFVAGGVSQNPPECLDHQDPTGGLYPFSMRLLSLCRSPAAGCGMPNQAPQEIPETDRESFGIPGVGCRYWMKGACPWSEQVGLFRSDFVEMSVGSSGEGSHGGGAEIEIGPPPEGDGAGQGESAGHVHWFLGPQRRAANLGAVREGEQRFQRALKWVFAYEHLMPEVRAQAKKSIHEELNLNREEIALLQTAIDGMDKGF